MNISQPEGGSPFANQPLEFPCNHCGRLLRVAAAVTGAVKCPACQSVQLPPGRGAALGAQANSAPVISATTDAPATVETAPAEASPSPGERQ
ncbi:MAG: hypothetical protein KDB23_30330, partial [Planctomycetales bacterium]|nr:hypothetical protein [Planctomycetales bacterium]